MCDNLTNPENNKSTWHNDQWVILSGPQAKGSGGHVVHRVACTKRAPTAILAKTTPASSYGPVPHTPHAKKAPAHLEGHQQPAEAEKVVEGVIALKVGMQLGVQDLRRPTILACLFP